MKDKSSIFKWEERRKIMARKLMKRGELYFKRAIHKEKAKEKEAS
jgi:hypothetical protein